MSDSIIKKKGSIVPKRFVKAIEKKSQHLVTFGCDVELVGLNGIFALTDGDIICVPSTKYVNTNKNKKTVKGFNFSNVHFTRKSIESKGACFKIDGQSNLWFEPIEVNIKSPIIGTYI